MRKLKLQMQTSIDGFVARPGGQLDWMVWDWDEALKQQVTALNEPVDCILLPRGIAEGFISTWAERAKADPSDWSARKFSETPRVLFSRTMTESPWEGVTLARGDIVAEIGRLKAADGGDIMAYGGGTFVSQLIKHGLIDEYHFFVNPVAIGEGITIFRDTGGKLPLKLVSSTAFECGIVELFYAPAS